MAQTLTDQTRSSASDPTDPADPGASIDPAEAEDAQDLARFRDGDELAFSRLFRRHAGRVQGLALRMLGRRDWAEDVVQETFLALHRKADTFRGDARFSTWLTSVALNAARMRLRKEKRAPLSLDDDAAAAIPAEPAAAPVADPAAADGRLARALDRLPRDARELLLLAALGHSYEELALMLALNPDQVRGRLYRARKSLQNELEEVA